MIISICNNLKTLSVLRIVNNIIDIIKISVPILLIFILIFKLIKAITNDDTNSLEKVKKTAISNILAAVIIFLIPSLIKIVVNITFPNSEYTKCINNSSLERINSIALTDINERIQQLKYTLSNIEYHDIVSDLKYLSDEDKNTKKEELDELYKSVVVMSSIKNIKKGDRDKYNQIVEYINNLNDEIVKNTLQTALNKYYNSSLITYDVIKPNPNENVIRSEETDTLKVYITKADTYYLTRIWVENANEQLNKEDSPEYGRRRYKPKELLQNAINNNNRQSELLIGFNASGFYLKDIYDDSSVRHYSGFNQTSVGTLVITNGKVVRNYYERGDIVTWFITGINSDNEMVVFEDKKMSLTNPTEKKEWADSIINSGVRNTLTFAAPVILDGQKTNYTDKNSRMPSSNSSKRSLQLICQINANNFALFTTSGETRNTAIDLFMDLGCKTAVNLDGGGSIALLYKSSSSTQVETIIGNQRALSEVAYFSQ